MTGERLAYIRSRVSLLPLVDHSNLIVPIRLVDGEEHYEVRDRLPPPVNEHGLPCPSIMLRELLGTMATRYYVWTGKLDLHHLAYPKADYTVANTPLDGDLGSAYRGLGMLKIEIPRQMHVYSHAIFEPPRIPSYDIMRQALMEIAQAQRIYRIIGAYSTAYTLSSEERQRNECLSRVHDELDSFDEPQLGIFPMPEALAGMEIEQLQEAVRAILAVRRVSDLRIIHSAVISPRYEEKTAA